ncbi:NADH:flavin oxidoreductase [Streptomyces sp. ME19-01-6]|uniref:NADH:flavin oxidoreductase n=1 Tax=Streptomyces sp. ME19-01-6 TaxID=3028686 RepID=UPI0029BA2A57|nr:NADH:flavin oxidoreductase [Streptomyces sp. ME19-01-6]MDX3233529.1 NADH:flavin oxidoreductase [Streptomyces sp. ME19-01-6]
MTTTSAADRIAQVLGRPFSVGSLTVPNRIVMAPLTREFSPEGVPGDDVARYYARRAAADVGLVITEGTFVHHPSSGTSDRVPRLWGEAALAGWRGVVSAVHQVGGKIIPQLWHVGSARTEGAGPVRTAPPVGPSGLALDGSPKGVALSITDVDDVIKAFTGAAAAAQELGFDGLELHGAHGYLIDQFLWGRTNRRTDAYGGDLASRVRFAAEVVEAVRAAVAPDFPVFFRLSQWKSGHYEARLADTPAELEAILAPLVEAGVDVFHASTRRYWIPEFEGSDLNLAGWTRKLTGKPSVTVGSVGLDKEFAGPDGRPDRSAVTGISELLNRAERDEFDLVAVGRALLADPEWARKALAGRPGDAEPYDAALLKALY